MSFEKEYYESPEFWSKGMIEDQNNQDRIWETISLLPDEISSLLDVGCGNGAFPNKLQEVKSNINVTSTDRSREALRYVNTNKFESDISEIPSEDKSYDCVTCLQVIEHLPDDIFKKSLSELSRISNKYVVISVPFNENIKKNFTSCPKCHSEFNADLHLRNFSLQDMESLLKEYGFELKKYKNVVKSTAFIGLNYYYQIRQLISKSKKSEFNSPICPICGYKNLTFKSEPFLSEIKQVAVKNPLKELIKKIWPKKEIPGYWIIAVYKRIEL